jgi:hypothetical protein
MAGDNGPYRALSSVARRLLPRAERMHTEGMTWRQIAQELRISYTALHIWRKLRETQENPSPGPRETQLETRTDKDHVAPAAPAAKNTTPSPEWVWIDR